MKKMIILFVAVFASFATTYAGNGKSINSIINKALRVPPSLSENKLNEKVNVQFKITENGKATLLYVETTNPELKKYITAQFPKIDFKNAGEKADGIYIIDINFKVL